MVRPHYKKIQIGWDFWPVRKPGGPPINLISLYPKFMGLQYTNGVDLGNAVYRNGIKHKGRVLGLAKDYKRELGD